MNKRPTQPINVRVAVINTLLAIQEGRSLSNLLDPLLNSFDASDNSGNKGFAHALLLTTLRHWYATARLLDSLADNPIEEVEVRTTIQLGITQLLYLNVADHAAINETVDAVKLINAAHASGLTNAILRKIAKNPNKFAKRTSKKHSLPNWLAMQLKVDWREYYDELMQALRQTAPMFLRVNELQTTMDNYLNVLSNTDIETAQIKLQTAVKLDYHTDKSSQTTIEQTAVRLVNSVPVSRLPDFETGIASVQDAHAQLAAPIIHSALTSLVAQGQLDSTKQIRLLDACAAPGGKLAHWLEKLSVDETSKYGLFHVKQDADETVAANERNSVSNDDIEMVAIDNEPNRITRVCENLERLELPAPIVNTRLQLEIICADATVWQGPVSDADKDKASENAKTRFDAILLDAPCTATGVIRRHPDITLLRTEEDIQHTVQLQEQILDNLWPLLNKGGYFLYVTCSILKAENVEQMQAFMQRHPDAVSVPFNNEQTNWGIEQAIGRQCLPLDNTGGDGFYYALLRKV